MTDIQNRKPQIVLQPQAVLDAASGTSPEQLFQFIDPDSPFSGVGITGADLPEGYQAQLLLPGEFISREDSVSGGGLGIAQTEPPQTQGSSTGVESLLIAPEASTQSMQLAYLFGQTDGFTQALAAPTTGQTAPITVEQPGNTIVPVNPQVITAPPGVPPQVVGGPAASGTIPPTVVLPPTVIPPATTPPVVTTPPEPGTPGQPVQPGQPATGETPVQPTVIDPQNEATAVVADLKAGLAAAREDKSSYKNGVIGGSVGRIKNVLHTKNSSAEVDEYLDDLETKINTLEKMATEGKTGSAEFSTLYHELTGMNYQPGAAASFGQTRDQVHGAIAGEVLDENAGVIHDLKAIVGDDAKKGDIDDRIKDLEKFANNPTPEALDAVIKELKENTEDGKGKFDDSDKQKLEAVITRLEGLKGNTNALENINSSLLGKATERVEGYKSSQRTWTSSAISFGTIAAVVGGALLIGAGVITAPFGVGVPIAAAGIGLIAGVGLTALDHGTGGQHSAKEYVVNGASGLISGATVGLGSGVAGSVSTRVGGNIVVRGITAGATEGTIAGGANGFSMGAIGSTVEGDFDHIVENTFDSTWKGAAFGGVSGGVMGGSVAGFTGRAPGVTTTGRTGGSGPSGRVPVDPTIPPPAGAPLSLDPPPTTGSSIRTRVRSLRATVGEGVDTVGGRFRNPPALPDRVSFLRQFRRILAQEGETPVTLGSLDNLTDGELLQNAVNYANGTSDALVTAQVRELLVGHGVMVDAAPADALRSALQNVGYNVDGVTEVGLVELASDSRVLPDALSAYGNYEFTPNVDNLVPPSRLTRLREGTGPVRQRGREIAQGGTDRLRGRFGNQTPPPPGPDAVGTPGPAPTLEPSAPQPGRLRRGFEAVRNRISRPAAESTTLFTDRQALVSDYRALLQRESLSEGVVTSLDDLSDQELISHAQLTAAGNPHLTDELDDLFNAHRVALAGGPSTSAPPADPTGPIDPPDSTGPADPGSPSGPSGPTGPSNPTSGPGTSGSGSAAPAPTGDLAGAPTVAPTSEEPTGLWGGLRRRPSDVRDMFSGWRAGRTPAEPNALPPSAAAPEPPPNPFGPSTFDPAGLDEIAGAPAAGAAPEPPVTSAPGAADDAFGAGAVEAPPSSKAVSYIDEMPNAGGWSQEQKLMLARVKDDWDNLGITREVWEERVSRGLATGDPESIANALISVTDDIHLTPEQMSGLLEILDQRLNVVRVNPLDGQVGPVAADYEVVRAVGSIETDDPALVGTIHSVESPGYRFRDGRWVKWVGEYRDPQVIVYRAMTPASSPFDAVTAEPVIAPAGAALDPAASPAAGIVDDLASPTPLPSSGQRTVQEWAATIGGVGTPSDEALATVRSWDWIAVEGIDDSTVNALARLQDDIDNLVEQPGLVPNFEDRKFYMQDHLMRGEIEGLRGQMMNYASALPLESQASNDILAILRSRFKVGMYKPPVDLAAGPVQFDPDFMVPMVKRRPTENLALHGRVAEVRTPAWIDLETGRALPDHQALVEVYGPPESF